MLTPAITEAVVAGVFAHGGLAGGLSALDGLVWVVIPYLLCALLYVPAFAIGLVALTVQVIDLRQRTIRVTGFFAGHGRFLFGYSLAMSFLGTALVVLSLIGAGSRNMVIVWENFLFCLLPYLIGGVMARGIIRLAKKSIGTNGVPTKTVT